MKAFTKSIVLVALTLTLTGSAWSAGTTVAGKWKGQFDSQIGLQRYSYEFKVDGTNLTGTATGEREMGTNTMAITEGRVGKVSGDEIKFHRKVGDFGEEDFVAKRVTEAESTVEAKPAAKSETKLGTNSPAAKP